MRVVRDRWGEKWVRHYERHLVHASTWHERFRWNNPRHVFTLVTQLGRIPEVGDA